MNRKKTIEFKRGVKAMATQNDWLVEIADAKGPSERIVIYSKEGAEIHRIATIILRKDQKEIDPGVARAMLRKLRGRLEDETVDALGDSFHDSLQTLVDWIKIWFS